MFQINWKANLKSVCGCFPSLEHWYFKVKHKWMFIIQRNVEDISFTNSRVMVTVLLANCPVEVLLKPSSGLSALSLCVLQSRRLTES